MADAEVTKRAAYYVECEPGDYLWCACGRSSNQPFCDGSHQGSHYQPLKITVTEKRKISFCGCKRTKRPPFCDGSHLEE